MNTIKLIRNKWFLLIFSIFFFGIVWCSFQLVYRDELVLLDLYRDNKPPDPVKVMVLYQKMMRTKPNPHEIASFYRLAKVLARVEKEKGGNQDIAETGEDCSKRQRTKAMVCR